MTADPYSFLFGYNVLDRLRHWYRGRPSLKVMFERNQDGSVNFEGIGVENVITAEKVRFSVPIEDTGADQVLLNEKAKKVVEVLCPEQETIGEEI